MLWKADIMPDIYNLDIYNNVVGIIADITDIAPAAITPQSNAVSELHIDSLDFLDIIFAIDKKFGIKIPLEQWMQEVNEGNAAEEDYFTIEKLCQKIQELIEQKVY